MKRTIKAATEPQRILNLEWDHGYMHIDLTAFLPANTKDFKTLLLHIDTKVQSPLCSKLKIINVITDMLNSSCYTITVKKRLEHNLQQLDSSMNTMHFEGFKLKNA